MNDDLRIESATIEDLPQLTEMLFDLFSHETDFQPDMDKHERGLRLLLEQPNRGRIFVLRTSAGLVGMINLLITISTAEGGFVLLLEDLVIRREHRGMRYGTMLLQHAIEFARQKNFLRITCLTDKLEDQSRKFFIKNGFYQSEMIPLRLLLRPDAGSHGPIAGT